MNWRCWFKHCMHAEAAGNPTLGTANGMSWPQMYNIPLRTTCKLNPEVWGANKRVCCQCSAVRWWHPAGYYIPKSRIDETKLALSVLAGTDKVEYK